MYIVFTWWAQSTADGAVGPGPTGPCTHDTRCGVAAHMFLSVLLPLHRVRQEVWVVGVTSNSTRFEKHGNTSSFCWDSPSFLTLHPSPIRCPDCSVCEKGYTRGQGYACVKCGGSSAHTVEALGAIALIALVAAFACAWKHLTSLARPSAESSKLGWQGYLWRIYKAIPFEAIRIMIITWQIITEVALLSLLHGSSMSIIRDLQRT